MFLFGFCIFVNNNVESFLLIDTSLLILWVYLQHKFLETKLQSGSISNCGRYQQIVFCQSCYNMYFHQHCVRIKPTWYMMFFVKLVDEKNGTLWFQCYVSVIMSEVNFTYFKRHFFLLCSELSVYAPCPVLYWLVFFLLNHGSSLYQ